LILFAFTTQRGFAQQESQFRQLRIFIDNDFLNFRGAGTDRYYTNGIRADYFFKPKEKPKFLSTLLLDISETNNNLFGWGLAQFMFTPKNISEPEIQYNDRPYAGALYAVHSLQSFDKINTTKVTTELFLGVIGPLSFADESQIWLHDQINYQIPQGWGNQVPNDLILNYNISIEKQLLAPSKSILLVGIAETFSGTLYNAAGVGFMLRIGKFNNYFEGIQTDKSTTKKHYQLFVSMRPIARIVASNALLQGGIIHQFTQDFSGYTLNKDQIERITFLYDVGLNLEFQKLGVHLTQKIRTPEFKDSYTQEVGNITLSYHF
jgi:hypothetical protein